MFYTLIELSIDISYIYIYIYMYVYSIMINNSINNHTISYTTGKEYNQTNRDLIHNPIITL